MAMVADSWLSQAFIPSTSSLPSSSSSPSPPLFGCKLSQTLSASSSSLSLVGRLQQQQQPATLCHSSSPSPLESPFTERHSCKPLRGGGAKLDLPAGKADPTGQSYRSSVTGNNEAENDIANCLPELKELLSLLHKDGKNQPTSDGTGNRIGNVFLIGTGPGDPELLTLKALRLMQTADLVLYDRLVSTDILNLVHSGARLLYVGKTSGYHSRTQDEIHQLLLSFAEAGATVLRLKGGDPLVFGRGGEEMDFLQQQGIQVRVIPGITAASGIAAELGIPLTHRGAANSVRFLTGHSMKGGSDPLFVAEQAADPDSTLVVYMGLSTLPSLAAKLIRSGLSEETPAVAVERGTTSFQRTVFAELKDLPGKVAAEQLVSPTLLVIGHVVALSPLWPSATRMKEHLNTAMHLPPVPF